MKYIEDSKKQAVKDIIESRHIPVTETGCWLWTWSASKSGYGDFRFDGKHYTAHQASYMAYHGKIDDDMHVMHKCDVRLCCNPNHLTIGTNYDNILDSMKKGRRKRENAFRPKGLKYKFTEESKKAYKLSHQKYKKDFREKIYKDYLNSKYIADVARINNISRNTVYAIVKEFENS